MEEKTESSQETEREVPPTEETESTKVVAEEKAEVEEETKEEISEGEAFEEEEIEKAPSRREEREEEFVEERIYTIPLRRAWIMPPNKRAPKAMRIIKAFIQRHMKVGETAVDEEEEGGKIIISNEVNEKIWSRGIERPPRKLRIRAAKDEKGNVTIFLA